MLVKILDTTAALCGVLGTAYLYTAVDTGRGIMSAVISLFFSVMLYGIARKENGERRKR